MKKNGFTLIEILISIMVLAVLAIVAVTSYVNLKKNVRDSARLHDLATVQNALEVYRSNHGYYPSTNGLSVALDALPQEVRDYLKQLPTDPLTDKVYRYQATSCDGVSFADCEDFLLCGIKEGNGDVNQPAGCSSLNCAVSGVDHCGLGLSAD